MRVAPPLLPLGLGRVLALLALLFEVRPRAALAFRAVLLVVLRLPLGYVGDDRLEERIHTARRHQGVGDRRARVREVFDDDGLKLGDDLAVDGARVFERAAAERDLKKKLEGDERDGKRGDARAVAAQVLAHEVEVARQPAVGVAQAPVYATVLKRPEDARGQATLREEREHGAASP